MFTLYIILASFVYNEGSSKSCLSFFNLKFFLKSTRPSLPLKKGLSKTHQSSLTLKFFLKSTRPSLPLKKAPPLFPSPFPLRGQGMCQPPYSVLKPLRYKVGGPSEVYASSGAAVFCAGWTAWTHYSGCLLLARCMLLAGIAVWGDCRQDGWRIA